MLVVRERSREKKEERERREEREDKRERKRTKRKRENDLFEGWEGLIAKTQKGRRVAARGRGWEQKRPGGKP